MDCWTDTIRTGGIAGALAVATALGAATQEPAATRSFPSEAAAITVDVLVLDDAGQPVLGLTKSDFVLLEDGQPQTIVGFKAREMAAGTPSAEAGMPTSVTESAAEVATNEPSTATPGRVLALLIDDLGISAITMSQLQPSLADWIRKRSEPSDEITIMTTSGDVWWSDSVARGKEDLLTVLARIKGKKLVEPESIGALSAWEAYRLDGPEAARDPEFRLSPVDERPRFLGFSILDRVLQRWFNRRVCECLPYSDCAAEVRSCVSRIRLTAQETHGRWALRAQAILATLGNLSRSLTAVSGRKSILLVSEEFLPDDSLSKPIRDAVSALQQGNASVYFLGARGLIGSPTFSVEQEDPPRNQDILGIGVEQTTLATEGGVALAEATGGVAITSSNDLAAGLDRMALEASAYYLLGYQPEKPPDGKWRKLEVRVSRPGVKVRARKRYLAERPEDVEGAGKKGRRAEKGKEEKLSKRELPPALLTGSARGTLPLRLGAYIEDTNHAGQARVRIVLEIDNGRVKVDRTGLPWRATLDLTILVAGLNRAPLVPVDERLSLSLEAKDVGNGWWLLPREVWLPPGVAQVRVFARDTQSKAEGVVTERLVVPDVDQPYLSTPVITDRTLPAPKAGEPPRLVPTAQRRFGRERPLVCQYEVYSFGGRTLEGVPQLVASYALQGPTGDIVSAESPKPIETDGFHAVRRITLPTEKLSEGPYELVVRVDDRLAQRTLTSRAPFVIEAGKTAGTPEPPAQP